ncbi:MAG TPA: class I SAM-dependent methyltransferase [Streptosporangiaceae bacterium]
MTAEPYFRHDLAVVHERGYGLHAERCAPGVLALLEPVRGGLVLEIGCGTGALTRHLLAAGHRVLATDASPAVLELAREGLGPAAELVQLTLPDDPLPQADAIVSIGHAVSYLATSAEVDRALTAMAGALRPGGVLAIDICDLDWGTQRAGAANLGRAGADWAVITEFSQPSPDRFVRDITTFVPDGHGAWRRDSEHHENVLVDTSRLPELLQAHAVSASVRASFGQETLPAGLKTLVGIRH